MAYKFLYETVDDRVQRLNGTYCTYGKDVVYVEYRDGFIFRGTTENRQHFDIDIRSEEFSAVPFSLGWFNFDGAAYYMARSAQRQSRQGYTSRVLSLTNIRSQNVNDRVSILGGLDYLWKGVYPSVTDAIKTLTAAKTVSSVAISRDTVLFNDEIGIVKVMYQQEIVGWFSKSEGVCRVLDTPKAPWFEKFLGCYGLKVEKGIDL